MKLVWKLTLVLLLAQVLVFGLYGWRSVEREVGLFEEELRNDARVGRTLAGAAAHVWSKEGRERALATVATARDSEESLDIRAVQLDAPRGDSFAPTIDTVRGVEKVGQAVHAMAIVNGEPHHFTYLRIPQTGPGSWAIEISRSRALLDDYARRTSVDMAIATGSAVLVSALLAILLGRALVGQPVRALVQQARDVGAGRLDARIDLPRRDELTELAAEMNNMAESLARARGLASRPRRALASPRSSSSATPTGSRRSDGSRRGSPTRSARRSTSSRRARR